MFHLPEIVYCHAVPRGDFGRRLPIYGIFAVCGDGALLKHRAGKNMFDGGIVPGNRKARVNDCGGVWIWRRHLAYRRQRGFAPSRLVRLVELSHRFAPVAVDEEPPHHCRKVTAETPFFTLVISAAKDVDKLDEYILDDVVCICRPDSAILRDVKADYRLV